MANSAERIVAHREPDPTPSGSAPLARWLAWVVLLVMAAALVYTGWISLANFNRIGV
jgi:hypothetical protein